ncbi:hypothetical protein FOCC_FOCC004376 [Frankliniella occidentalis]|uniref:Uncharacterized protein LOC113205332 n=1 Tax=Frankliniella occidentalis TaxID=133901 RepID=A0A6J1S664_FRAOC|nr:uncharacterized protein LOC113205332 [Frankliniella occidentalis]KAE8748970.1 hypothetical protein FOCC_FOCC004376 [Frankliniella occidentalis]
MSTKVMLIVALLAIALVFAQAMPPQSLLQPTESSTATSSTPVNGDGGNGGTGGWCWSGSSCKEGCQRAGFPSGYCFVFRCYCSNE